MTDRLSDEDEITIRAMAYVERTTFAAQRRKAIRAYAKRARRNENVAELVAQMLAWKRQRDAQAAVGNVIQLKDRRHA